MHKSKLRRLFHKLPVVMLLTIPGILFSQNIKPKFDADKGKWGFVDTNDKWVVKPKFESAKPFDALPDGKQVSEVSDKGLTGYMSQSGKMLGNGTVNESIRPLTDRTILVKVKGKWGITDCEMVYLVKPELETIEELQNKSFLVSTKGKYGILNYDGTYLIAPEYNSVDLSIPEYIRLTKGNKMGLADRKGAILIEPSDFTQIEPFGNYWKVLNNDKTGLYDLDKRALLVKPEYADVDTPVTLNGVFCAPVMKNGVWGALWADGKEALKFRYNDFKPIEGIGAVLLRTSDGEQQLWFPAGNSFLTVSSVTNREDGPFTLMSGTVRLPGNKDQRALSSFNRYFKNGEMNLLFANDGKLLSSSYATIRHLDKWYMVRTDSRNVLYDKDGNIIMNDVPEDYSFRHGWLMLSDRALSPEQKLYTTKRVGPLTFVNDQASGDWRHLDNGKIASTGYETVQETDGIVHACRQGKWGVLTNGVESVPCNYSKPLTFDKSLNGFYVIEGNKKGLINLSGDEIIPARFTSIERFNSTDNYIVKNEDGSGLLNKDGTTLIEPAYSTIEYLSDFDIYKVGKNELFGLVSAEGTELTPVKYESFKPNGLDDHMWAKCNGVYGVINAKGETIVPVKYGDPNLNMIENRYYEITGNGSPVYYNRYGEQLTRKRQIKVTSQYLEHNFYNDNGYKCVKAHYSFDTEFLLEEPIYVELKFFNANGTPALNSKGQQIKHGWWATPSYLFATFSDKWITMPNNNFRGTRGTRKDYYAKFFFYDQSNRLIPTTGNDKLTFYMNFN